jgi:hypothetical protein
MQCSKEQLLLDDLVGSREQRSWHDEAEGLCCIPVDHEWKFDWVLNWKVRRIFTFEDSRDVRTGASIDVRIIWTIPYQGTLVRRRGPRAYHC